MKIVFVASKRWLAVKPLHAFTTYSRHWHNFLTQWHQVTLSASRSSLLRVLWIPLNCACRSTSSKLVVCYKIGLYQLCVELQPYKWPYKWETGVITLHIGDISPFITRRGPLSLCFDVRSSELSYFISSYRYSLLAVTFSSQHIFQVSHVSIENMYIAEMQCKGVEASFQNVDGMYI